MRRNVFDCRSEKRLGDLIYITMLNILNGFLNSSKKAAREFGGISGKIQIINNRRTLLYNKLLCVTFCFFELIF